MDAGGYAWQVSRQAGRHTHLHTHTHVRSVQSSRSRIIRASDWVMGFSIPVVKFPSSRRIALRSSRRNFAARLCQKIRDTTDATSPANK